MRPVALAALVGLCGCAGTTFHRPRFPDVPMQLADDADRDQAIDRLWALPPGPERDAVRARVAAALAQRISSALDEGHPYAAQDLLFQLCALWRSDPQQVASGLAGQLALIRRLRATFARSGAIEPAIATLVLLAELDPAHRAAYLGELDLALSYADGLEAAEAGADSERAQPIELLQPTVLALPLPWLVDRYVALLEQRQRAVETLRVHQQLPVRLVDAHHDVIHTAHRIANVLARAGRLSEIAAHLGGISGLGADRDLALRAEVLAERPSADAYADLADALASDRETPDPAAALAVCLRGLTAFPRDGQLLASAAADAAELGRVDQPITLYERAVQVEGGDVEASLALRLGRLYAQRIARLAFGGRPSAATIAWRELQTYSDRAARHGPSDAWREVAAIGEASLGRGLVSQGQLADAERALEGSLDRAPSIEAYETLATIYGKTGRLVAARRFATEGLALLGTETAGDRYHRAKLERIAADNERYAGRTRDAVALYLDSIAMWKSLGKDDDLPPRIAAERKLESARGLYYIGSTENAVDRALASTEVDPESPTAATEAEAFLLEIGRPGDAADALHRALGSPSIGELSKVYACLWSLGDAHRRGRPPDSFAVEYLRQRSGDLWYERLAEAATGRLGYAALAAAATTPARRADLTYYGTVLGLDPAAATPAAARAHLQQVVRAGLVMDAEYDLARQYLTR